MQRKRFWGLALLFSFFLVLWSCQDNSTSPRTDEPEQPDPNELVVNPDTKDIDSQQWIDSIQEIDSTNFTITFTGDFNEAAEWEENDVIVSAKGEGLLRKVTSVNQSNNSIVVSTEQATLSDYIQQGEIRETVQLEIENVQKVRYLQEGVQLLTDPGTLEQHKLYKEKSKGLPWRLDTDIETSSGVIIELYGEYLLETDLTLDVKISWLAQLQHFEMSYELRNTLDLGMKAESELSVASSIKLAEVTFAPIYFSIPPAPVPFVVIPKLIVNLGVNGEITGEIVTDVAYQNTVKLGSRYERGTGWSEILERSDEFSFDPPSIELGANIEAFLNPQYEIALYGVLSGYLTASLYSELEAALDRDPWWELFMGIRAGVGAKATVIGKDLIDHSKPDLLEERWSVAKAAPVAKPDVLTGVVSNVTENEAVIEGEVSRPEHATPITERGVCWSDDNDSPTLSDTCQEAGSGEGDFSVNISRLDAGTEYFITAYGTNSGGTSYGDAKSFTTGNEAVVPTVTTSSVTSIGTNSAESGGIVTNNGGENVTLRGVCWSTSQNPDRDDDCTRDGSDVGEFTSLIAGLNPDTGYYVRAYAVNSEGTGYGEEREFTTEEEPNKSPKIEITDGPDEDATLTENEVRFEWQGSDSDGDIDKYEVELNGPDDVDFETDNSSREFNDLNNGDYTFRVRAVDNKGAKSGWAERDFSIDVEPPNKAPTVEIIGGTNDGAILNTDTANFEWQGSDSDGTIEEYEVELDGPIDEEFTTTTTFTDFDDLENGVYTFNVRAVDNEGADSEWASRSFTIDIEDEIELPTVTTATISSIAENAAEGGGEVTDDGGADITARGICWGMTQNPTTGDTCTSDGTGNGVFTSDLTGLTADTEYYVRAYATNSVGTAYGSQESFTTTASQAEAPLFTVSLTLSDDANTLDELKFGIKKSSEIMEAPPAPPEGSLHAFFVNDDEELFEDFRDQSLETQTWELQYSIGDGEEITMSWDLDPASFEGSLTIQDENGEILRDMKAESQLKFSDNEYQHLTIEFK